MQFGVADYGMNVWDGGCFDLEQRLVELKEIGFQGIERLGAVSADDAVHKAASFRKLGMDFATCRGPDVGTTIEWTAALGKPYVWTNVLGKTFEAFLRQCEAQARRAARFGIKVVLHNHLGTFVENAEQLDRFMTECPNCYLLLDTAHLAAADGDPIEAVQKYHERIASVHLKDWLVTDPDVGLDRWPQRGRFCELNAGNIGLDNVAVMNELVKHGYDGWVFIEHDTHLQDPLVDLKHSLGVLKDAGF